MDKPTDEDRAAARALTEEVHQLGNVLHLLTLRLELLRRCDLAPPERAHVEEATRLAVQNISLLADVNRVQDGAPAPRRKPRLRLTPPRSPR